MKRKEETNKDRKTNLKDLRDLSFQEIGSKLDLSRMRICQLEKQILNKIKKMGLLDDFVH